MSVTGVEGEERNDYSTAESRQIRQRSLRLLGSLIRPVRARVALLEDGRVTAVGTHHELLATSEHYRFVISSLDAEGDALDTRNDQKGGRS